MGENSQPHLEYGVGDGGGGGWWKTAGQVESPREVLTPANLTLITYISGRPQRVDL